MNMQEIINTWQQSENFEDNGYGDLAFTLKSNALNEIRDLEPKERLQVVDIIMPIHKNGN